MLPLGFTIAEGSSVFDSQPIVAIATGLARKSRNRKTGAVVQVYVLLKDVLPSAALASHSDSSVCGNCRHRVSGLGTCYVDVVRGADVVWRSFKAGLYPPIVPDVGFEPGSCFRVTAYGDCAAMPYENWKPFLGFARKADCAVLGYTHNWRHCDTRFQGFCMASVETTNEQREAAAAGWRTFRIRMPNAALQAGEVQCPADTHADVFALCGVKPGTVTCDICRKCVGGTVGEHVSLYPHGVNFKKTALTSWLKRATS